MSAVGKVLYRVLRDEQPAAQSAKPPAGNG
jgi:hypothetical protein